jgi:hypothetical protein
MTGFDYNCPNGCGHNAKIKLTTNYLYLAEKTGVEVQPLSEVYELAPLDAGGFEVRTRYPGWTQRAADLRHHSYTAEQVIVAHSLARASGHRYAFDDLCICAGHTAAAWGGESDG